MVTFDAIRWTNKVERKETIPTHAICCNCGAVVYTREEKDGGFPHGAQLSGGDWVCSSECWDVAKMTSTTKRVTDGCDKIVQQDDVREQIIERLVFVMPILLDEPQAYMRACIRLGYDAALAIVTAEEINVADQETSGEPSKKGL